MFVRYRTYIPDRWKTIRTRIGIIKPMKRTVQEHIQDLEQRLLSLNTRIMEGSNDGVRNQLESELRAVESALTLYRTAS